MPMSTKSKQLLAIGVVVVVAVAGVGAYLLISSSGGPRYVVPGAPSDISSSQIIKVGVLDDFTDVTGIGSWQGSYLAAYEINSAGGVVVNGTHYYFGLIREDTSEAAPAVDPSKGVTAAQKLVSVDGVQFVTGGFRTESLLAYIDTVMNAKLVFIGTGSATNNFTQNVLDNYAKYKYFFRDQPINSSALGTAAFTELAYLRQYIGAVFFAGNTSAIHKWAIIRENLDWTKAMDDALHAYMVYYGWDASPTDDVAFDPSTVSSSDFNGYWSTIQGHGAQMVIPIISAAGGVIMDQTYNATQPKCLICGINVQSQLDSFWASTQGKCKYEVVLQTFVRTNKSVNTIPFWDHYVGNYTSSPIYTSAGGYDAIQLLKNAIYSTQSFVSDRIVTALEGVNRGSPYIGVAGPLVFTRSHDLLYGLGYGVPIFAQWQAGGTKPCITSGGLLYPNSITTGTLQIPSWGMNS
jgi:branched-chain amino acid transport system substrate-binding protein